MLLNIAYFHRAFVNTALHNQFNYANETHHISLFRYITVQLQDSRSGCGYATDKPEHQRQSDTLCF